MAASKNLSADSVVASMKSPADSSEVNDLSRNKIKEIEALSVLVLCATLNDVDSAKNNLSEKLFKLKEEFVLANHKNAITQTQIKKNGTLKTVYQTRCGDTRPRCSTYEALIEKLYDYYANGKASESGYTFKSIFEKAIQLKIDTESPKEKTIDDYRDAYKALITEELGKRDIRTIKPSELKIYILDTVKRLNLTVKRLHKLKGILNLVFEYASDPERFIVQINPVPKSNKAVIKSCRTGSNKPEDKAFQVDDIKRIREELWKRIGRKRYDVNAFAVIFASHTGIRQAEIPSLKWSDIEENRIHIHSQQNDVDRDGHTVYYYNPCTKNEKGISKDGRHFPMTSDIRELLSKLKAKQKEYGIDSEWVFAKANGDWITTQGYYEYLYRLCHDKLELRLTNNHAFRIALNSYVLIPAGLDVTERAKILGHSVETNLKYYTFSKSDEYLHEIGDKLEMFASHDKGVENGTPEYLKTIPFCTKKKSPETANF